MKKKKITWTNGKPEKIEKIKLSKLDLTPRYLGIEENSTQQPHLTYGSMWKTTIDLTFERKFSWKNYRIDAEIVKDASGLQVLVAGNNTFATFQKNTVAIYYDSIYVDEKTTSGTLIRSLKHRFFIQDGIYILKHLSYLEPVA